MTAQMTSSLVPRTVGHASASHPAKAARLVRVSSPEASSGRTSAVRRHIRGFWRVSGLVRGLKGSVIGEIV